MGQNVIPNWHALGQIPPGTLSLLDVGCNVGETLKSAHSLGIATLAGIEINPFAAEIAKKNLIGISNCKIHQGSADTLPFPSESFDVVTCLEVLEHVPVELRANVLKEIKRVLKPNGTFILSVPHSGLFSFLDPSNMRFRLPQLTGFIFRLLGGKGRDRGFEGQSHGVVWHHHFRASEIESLFEPNFEIKKFYWRGCLLVPLGEALLFPLYRLQKFDSFLFKLIKKIQHWDMSIQWGQSLAYNVVVIAKKRS